MSMHANPVEATAPILHRVILTPELLDEIDEVLGSARELAETRTEHPPLSGFV
jgi:hypothetical protein